MLRTQSIIALLLCIFTSSCWIASDPPDRYITRIPKANEFYGQWNINKTSLEKIEDDEGRDYSGMDYRTFFLNKDSTVLIPTQGNSLSGKRWEPNEVLNGKWSLEKEVQFVGSQKQVYVLRIQIEEPVKYHNGNKAYKSFDLKVYEENGQLILWQNLGSYWDENYLDFVKK